MPIVSAPRASATRRAIQLVLGATTLCLAVSGCAAPINPIPATAQVTPTSTPTVTTAPAPPAPIAVGPVLTATEIAFFEDSITSRNTDVIDQSGAEVDPIPVTEAGQNCCGVISAVASINALNYVIASNPTWSFTISLTDLAADRASQYGSMFPINALVGHSSDNETIAYSFNSAHQVSNIFMAKGSF